MNYTYQDLLDVDEASLTPRRKNELHTELFSRWLTALTPLFFALIGMGLGTVRARGTSTSAALVSLMIILPTYALQMLGQNLGFTGALPPFLAMLIPDLFLFGVGVWAYRRAIW